LTLDCDQRAAKSVLMQQLASLPQAGTDSMFVAYSFGSPVSTIPDSILLRRINSMHRH